MISIYIFKIRKGEYKEEMSDMKSIASLMIKVSIRKESIGIEISDSFQNNMEMFLISINLKLMQLLRFYVLIENIENERISVIIDFKTKDNVIEEEYCITY